MNIAFVCWVLILCCCLTTVGDFAFESHFVCLVAGIDHQNNYSLVISHCIRETASTMFDHEAGGSRQRIAVSSGMPHEDDNNGVQQQQHVFLVESSISTDDAEQDKYDKRSRRTKKLRRAKKGSQKSGNNSRTTVGLVFMFTVILLVWHFTVKVRQDRRRHAKALYDRAETILQNMKHQPHHHPKPPPRPPRRPPPGVRPPNIDDDHFAVQPGPPQQQQFAGSGGIPSTQEVEDMFAYHRVIPSSLPQIIPGILSDWRKRWDMDVLGNVHGGIRWIRPYLLPGVGDLPAAKNKKKKVPNNRLIQAERANRRAEWQDEWDQLVAQYGGHVDKVPGPPVDYTDPDKYEYPPLMEEPPAQGGYPHMTPLGDLMSEWDQDSDKEGIIHEILLHFDYTNPREMAMAEKFREAMLPFKLYNVPELERAGKLWTDEYVAEGFKGGTHGTCQESPNHYFAFYTPNNWSPERMGLPPTRNNDMAYVQFAQHARYADATRLASDAPHFYWQSGVDREERYQPETEWSFVSRDLPSWSATEPNFIMFNPEDQKGIQCRFGERGVVAATHYDSGRYVTIGQ